MNNIKNIIFDLGGVIINLDIKATVTAFNTLSSVKFEDIYTQAKQDRLFDLFDKGKITEEDFFKQLGKEINYYGPQNFLIDAWNAMLLDFPEERLDTLVEAKQNYTTFLLSNTNETHISIFENNLYQVHGIKHFSDYFDGLYYSCRMGMRKPDAEIFEFVLQKNNLLASETVFIDDSIQHVKGAGSVGINAFLLEKNMEVKTLLQQLKLL